AKWLFSYLHPKIWNQSQLQIITFMFEVMMELNDQQILNACILFNMMKKAKLLWMNNTLLVEFVLRLVGYISPTVHIYPLRFSLKLKLFNILQSEKRPNLICGESYNPLDWLSQLHHTSNEASFNHFHHPNKLFNCSRIHKSRASMS